MSSLMGGQPIELDIVVYDQGSSDNARRHANGPGGLWVWTPRRQHPYYVCSAGVTHERWWRLHTPGGGPEYPVRLACAEHEVIETRATVELLT